MAAPAGTGDQQQPGSTPGKKEDFDYENFDWVALTKEIRSSPETGKAYVETDWEKFQRKFGDNPLVPIGCAVTTACLVSGIIRLFSFQSHCLHMYFVSIWVAILRLYFSPHTSREKHLNVAVIEPQVDYTMASRAKRANLGYILSFFNGDRRHLCFQQRRACLASL